MNGDFQIVIVAFQVSQYGSPGPLSAPAINSFLDIFGVLVNGALVPAIVRRSYSVEPISKPFD